MLSANSAVSQTIEQLKPGRLYTIELISCDRDGLLAGKTQNEKHPVIITCNGLAWIEDKCFQTVYKNFGYYHLGPYDDEEAATPIYMNYHRRVFRASRSTADLTIAGGQGRMINFVQVQPYFE